MINYQAVLVEIPLRHYFADFFQLLCSMPPRQGGATRIQRIDFMG